MLKHLYVSSFNTFLVAVILFVLFNHSIVQLFIFLGWYTSPVQVSTTARVIVTIFGLGFNFLCFYFIKKGSNGVFTLFKWLSLMTLGFIPLTLLRDFFESPIVVEPFPYLLSHTFITLLNWLYVLFTYVYLKHFWEENYAKKN